MNDDSNMELDCISINGKLPRGNYASNYSCVSKGNFFTSFQPFALHSARIVINVTLATVMFHLRSCHYFRRLFVVKVVNHLFSQLSMSKLNNEIFWGILWPVLQTTMLECNATFTSTYG